MTARPTLLLTRPAPQSERFARMCLAAIGAEVPVVISPVLRIVPQPFEPPQDLQSNRPQNRPQGGFGDVILTSANGARALAELCDVTGRRAYCVGDHTAEVAQALGMEAISAKGAAPDLIALIKLSDPKQPLLHARGQETRGEIAQNLRAEGIEVRSEVLYTQQPCDLSAEAEQLLDAEKPIVAPIFSPRSAKFFRDAVGARRRHCLVFPLSPAVAGVFSGGVGPVNPPPYRPNAQSLCDLIAAYYVTASG